jgi:hypothetical protein
MKLTAAWGAHSGKAFAVSLVRGINVALDATRIRTAIKKAVRTETELPDAILQEYHEFCQAPDKLSSQTIEKLLIDFLVHVPNHLAAASKLLTGIPVTDIFSVGSTTETDE